MNNDYRVWQDFNNISVEVKIDNIKYNSILYVENERLKLKIDCTKNIEKFDRNINIIDIINGKILKDGTKVAFINCFHYGMQSLGVGKNEYIYSIYRIDRVFLGTNLKNMQVKKISACKVVYQSIEENEDEGFIRLNKEIVVYLKSNKKVCFDDVMKKIYTFRNLMMILLKRNVIVKKQTLKINEKEYELFDCDNHEIKRENENLRSQLIFRNVKYEDIEDFNHVLEKFNLIYERICPLLELLYNAYSNKLPNLNRFLDAITMIEYYSREFDNTENVKDGRTYYVKNGWKLSHDKLFRYYNFLEDIILLNII